MTHKQQTQWKWARRIVLCLILGAIVNVAVAWVVAARMPRLYVQVGQPINEWPVPVPDDWLPPQAEYIAKHFAVRDRNISNVHDMPLALSPYSDIVFLREAGWPMRSMRGWDELGVFEHPRWAIFVHHLPSFAQKFAEFDAIIPLQPMPIGSTINTLFYGALTLGVFFAMSTLRRRRQSRRGLCANCAYDLAGLTVCPECGFAASPRGGEDVTK